MSSEIGFINKLLLLHLVGFLRYHRCLHVADRHQILPEVQKILCFSSYYYKKKVRRKLTGKLGLQSC
jgi:hypothetical protein